MAIALAVAAVLLFVVMVGTLMFAQSGWLQKPWRARVLSVRDGIVCTTPDRGERDPGRPDPLCLSETELGRHDLHVGECVLLRSTHPTIDVVKKVACA